MGFRLALMISSHLIDYNKEVRCMIYYAETAPGYGIEKSKLIIREQDNELIQRYDISTKSWVEDVSMYQIFTGDIECEPISEQQANKIIEGLS